MEEFLYVAWECLNIFKEAFPRKVELFQENFDKFCGFDPETFKNEIFRRQITYIQSLGKIQEKTLNLNECEEIFYVLEEAIQLRDSNAIKICLAVLNSNLIPPIFFFNCKEDKEIKALEILCQEEEFFTENELLNSDFSETIFYENKKISLNLINKILKIKNFRVGECQTELANQDSIEIFQRFRLEEPQSVSSQLFQLRESLDLERVTFILTEIMKKNEGEFTNKSGLFNAILGIIKRYSQGELGIDNSYLTKYCVFHNRILQYFFINLNDEKIFSELINRNSVGALAQIIQEGVLNIIQNIICFECQEMKERETFLNYSICIMEKLASYYLCKDIIKDALNYEKEIIENYIGSNEKGYENKVFKSLEVLGGGLGEFYEKILLLIKNIEITEERYLATTKEPEMLPKKVHMHRFLSKKTKDFLQKQNQFS